MGNERFVHRASVGVLATVQLNEVELRALEAIAGYDVESFLEVFYKHMGESYLRPHEQGLRSLFGSVRREVPLILRMADDARKAFVPPPPRRPAAPDAGPAAPEASPPPPP